MAKILIEVKGVDDEEESEIATLIATGLSARGFNNITLLINQGLFLDPLADARFKEAKKNNKGVDKDKPVVTVAKPTYH